MNSISFENITSGSELFCKSVATSHLIGILFDRNVLGNLGSKTEK